MVSAGKIVSRMKQAQKTRWRWDHLPPTSVAHYLLGFSRLPPKISERGRPVFLRAKLGCDQSLKRPALFSWLPIRHVLARC